MAKWIIDDSCLVYNHSHFTYTLCRWGIKILAAAEGRGSGITWGTLNDQIQPDDPVTMAVVWGMLIADIFIYGVITWYIDGIRPGKFGVARKWYFPFQKSYWCGTESEDGNSGQPGFNRQMSNQLGLNSGKYFEEEPEEEQAGIIVRDLVKIFKSIRSKLNSTEYSI